MRGHAKRGPVAGVDRGTPFDGKSASPYLLRTFLNRSEEALARANWPKPGSTDARLALMIWSKVLFFMVLFLSPRCRPVFPDGLFFPCRRPRIVYVFFLSSFFCCGFIVRRPVVSAHAVLVSSFAYPSACLEENVTKRQQGARMGTCGSYRVI